MTERLRSLGYLSAGAIASEVGGDLPDPKKMIGTFTDFEDAKRAVDDSRFAEAIPCFRRVLATQQKNLVALLGLALNRTHQSVEAEQVCRKALAMAPGNYTAISELGDALFGQERWAEALDLFRLAAPTGEKARQVNSRIAVCLALTGKEPEAAASLAAAGQRYPAEQRFFNNLGVEIQRYLQLSSQSGLPDSLVLRRAQLASDLGLFASCERALSRPLASPDAEVQRMRFLEDLYSAVGRPLQALEVLQQEEKKEGRTTERRLREANFLIAAGRNEEVLRVYDEIPPAELEKSGDLATVMYNRACVLSRVGRRDDALAALRGSVRSGFRDLAQLLNDSDLSGLREEPRYRALIDTLSSLVQGAGGQMH